MSTAATKTLDVLPGEGSHRTTIQFRERHLCEKCGLPAHFLYVLPFGKLPRELFLCRACQAIGPEPPAPFNMYPANEYNADRFLYWKTEAVNEPETGGAS